MDYLLAAPAARGPAAPVYAGPGGLAERGIRGAGRRRRVCPGRADRGGLHRAAPRAVAQHRRRRDPDRLPHLQLRPPGPLPAAVVRAGRPGGPVGGPLRSLRSDPDLGAQPPPRRVDPPAVDPPRGGEPPVFPPYPAAPPAERRPPGGRRPPREPPRP